MRQFNRAAFEALVKRAGGVKPFARLTGVAVSSIRCTMRGSRTIMLDTAARVADAMKVDIDSLLADADEKPQRLSLAAAMAQAGIGLSALAKAARVPKSTLCEAVRKGRRLKLDQHEAVKLLLAGRGVDWSDPRNDDPSWADRVAARKQQWETAMREPLRPEVREAFGLTREPFATVEFSNDALFRTADYKAAFDHILEAAEAKEFAVLCGPVGVGKTHCLHAALAELGQRERFIFCRVHATETERLGVPSICHALLADFGVRHVPGRVEARARLVTETLRNNDRAEKSAIVVVDEAHDVSTSILKQLKRFHEIVSETSFRPVLGIILCGQLPLKQALRNNPSLREVTWRASCVELRGLATGELREYLMHRLRRAGGSIQTWDQAATDELERRLSVPGRDGHGPIPLAANVVAAKAMALSFDHRSLRGGKAVVKAEDVREAVESVL